MNKITITNGKKSFTISKDSSAHLISHDGFYSPSYDIKLSSYASGTGSYPTKRSFGERILTLCFEIVGKNMHADRRLLTSLLDPSTDLTLIIFNDDCERKITVIPYGEAKISCESGANICECELSFVSPGIFFEDTEEKAYTAASGASPTVCNTGEVKCGFVLTLTAVGGEVKTPQIRLGSSYVKCPITMSDGDTLVIDTRERQKKVLLCGAKYYGFNSGSTFFSLPCGDSTITVSASSGSEYLSSDLKFTPLYYGI